MNCLKISFSFALDRVSGLSIFSPISQAWNSSLFV